MQNFHLLPFRTEWKIIFTLYFKKCSYYKELIHLLRANPDLVKNQLILLEEKKLIHRKPTGLKGRKPQAFFTLTPKGKRIGKRLSEIEQILKK